MRIILIVLFCMAASERFPYEIKFIDPAQRAISKDMKVTKSQTDNIQTQIQQLKQLTFPQDISQFEEELLQLRNSINKVRMLASSDDSYPTTTQTQATELLLNLGKSETVSLMPGDDEYDAIKLSLLTIIVLFIIIQLLSCACQKKKKRYGQKFEQYAHRTEAQEFDEQN